MERQFDTQIEEIKNLILQMGGQVEKCLDEVIQGLVHRDINKFALVHKIEEKINEDHVRVDNSCLNFLAKQGPVARDLRLIISVIKINSDLERMGDQCVNIAYTGKDYMLRAPVGGLQEIEKMSKVVRLMVKASLDSFVREDVELAHKILSMDDEVDDLKKKVLHDRLQIMKTQPESSEAALDIILIARNLERLGDHATNIAEDVIFVSTGKDIRHGGKYSATS